MTDVKGGIGLSTQGSTLHSSSLAGKRAGLDWKLKAALVMLLVAFLYATVSRVLKKKGEKKGGDKKAAAAATGVVDEKPEATK